jgi:hypothetical protein
LLNYHQQNLTPYKRFDIRKQTVPAEAKEPQPEPTESTMTILKLTEGLGLADGGIKAFENTGLKDQQQEAEGCLLPMKRF